MHRNIVTASVLAVISGLNRAWRKLPEAGRAGLLLPSIGSPQI
jgi:hypothetical protein